MRVFKWTNQFHADKESSLVPVWIKFPKLPVHLFNKEALFSLASLLGHPLRWDSATTSIKRPSVARIQIEIDLHKPPPPRLWIGVEEQQGFWQTIEVDETLPSYCNYCWHIGHDETICYIKNPELKVVEKTGNKVVTAAKPQKQYRPRVVPSQHQNSLPTSSAVLPPGGSALLQNDQQSKGQALAGVEELAPIDPANVEIIKETQATDEDGGLVAALVDSVVEGNIAPNSAVLVAQPKTQTEETGIANEVAVTAQTTNSETLQHAVSLPGSASDYMQAAVSEVKDLLSSPSSLQIHPLQRVDSRKIHFDGEKVDDRQTVSITDLQAYSTAFSQILQADGPHGERKRHPRKNYFDQPRTIFTRS